MNGSRITEIWADFVTGLRYSDLPSEVIQAVKVSTIDTLAAILAGTSSPTGAKVSQLVQSWGGAPESSIFPGRVKVPAIHAVLANAVFARARELDDALEMLPFHGDAVIIPAALAMAEKRGGLSGRDFITAIVAGVEVASRMGLASRTTGLSRPPQARSVWGTLGAATVAAKIRGVGTEEISRTWGIAFRAGGGSEFLGGSEADETLWLGCGLDAMHGVLASALATQGLTGPAEAIEEYFRRSEGEQYNQEEILGGIGERFAIVKMSLKAWPTCRMSHGAIEATLKIVREHNLLPQDVEEVKVRLNQLAFERACLPLDQKRAPRSVTDALFSIPFAVALAILNRRVTMSDFCAEHLNSREVLDLSARVKPLKNPEVKHPMGRPPAIVAIRTRDGSQFEHRVEYIKGNPKNPLTWEELRNKFDDCLEVADPPLSPAQGDKIVGFLQEIENREDVCELFALMRKL